MNIKKMERGENGHFDNVALLLWRRLRLINGYGLTIVLADKTIHLFKNKVCYYYNTNERFGLKSALAIFSWKIQILFCPL